MKNDRVHCLTSKLSKRMIWIAQNFTLRTKFTLRSPRGSKIQNLKALDNESNGFWNAWMLSGSRSKVMAPDVGSHGCLKCLNCLQASRLTPEQIDGWRQTFSGPHDCPALRFVPAWVIHCIVTARKKYEGKPKLAKLASTLWNLEIVPWIVVSLLSTNQLPESTITCPVCV